MTDSIAFSGRRYPRRSRSFPPAPFTPASLSLTAWVRDYPGSLPWIGQPSAGISGTSTNGSSSVNPPTAGTALDGFPTAQFTPNNQMAFDPAVAATTYVGLGSSFFAALVRATTLEADPGAGLRNGSRAIVGELGNQVGLVLTTSGPAMFVNQRLSAGYKDVKATTSDPTNAWIACFGWHDGVNLFVQANNDAPASTACDVANGYPSVVRLAHAGVVPLFAGRMAEVMTSNDASVSVNISKIYAYWKARYPSAALP